jgi:hypothetical protein
MLAFGSEAFNGKSQLEGRARRHGRLDDRQDNPKVLGPLHNRQGSRHAQTFGTFRSLRTSNPSSRGRHRVRNHQDWKPSPEQGSVCQAAPEADWS